MKVWTDYFSGVMASFWTLLLKEIIRLEENPDEILRLLVKPNGEVLMPGFAGFIVEQVKGKKPGKPLSQHLAEWKLFYKKFFCHDLDVDSIQIHNRPEGFDRLIVVAKGFTLTQIYNVMARHFDCWRYDEKKDLDNLITRNDRDANKTGTYGIWLRDRQEADEENAGKSADQLQAEKHLGITLGERMLYELKFWDETGCHLDMDNLTLCAGSRNVDVDVPFMYFRSGGGEVCVYYCCSDFALPRWRTRSAGSSS